MLKKKIEDIVLNIRKAVYGLDVRESIAEGIDAIYKEEVAHKEETERILNEQKVDIDAVKEKFEEIVANSGDSVLEIVDARVGYNTLKEKLDAMDEDAKEISGDEIFYIYNAEGEVVGQFSSEGIYISELTAGSVNADNLITMGEGKTKTVRIPAGEDIQFYIDNIPKYLKADLNFQLENGEYYGDISIFGFMGIGNMKLQFSESTVLYGTIYNYSSSTAVIVDGATTGKVIHNSARESIIRSQNSAHMDVRNIVLEGVKGLTRWGVSGAQGSSLRVADNYIHNCTKGEDAGAISATHNARVYSANNKGDNNQNSVVSLSAGVITVYGKSPKAKNDKYIGYGGIINGTVSMDGVVNDAPAPETTVKTVKFNATSFKSYRGVDGWRSGIYQGRYDKSKPISYNYSGCYMFDTAAIKSQLSGKEIKSVKLTLKRKAEGQGVGQPSTAVLKLHSSTSTGSGDAPALSKTYGNIGSVAKSKSITASVSKDIIKNFIAGHKCLVLNHSDGSNYCLMENVATLEVQYVDTLTYSNSFTEVGY